MTDPGLLPPASPRLLERPYNIYTITIIHRLSIYTSMKHSLLLLKLLALALNSLDTLCLTLE